MSLDDHQLVVFIVIIPALIFGLIPYLMRRKAKVLDEVGNLLFPGELFELVSSPVFFGIPFGKELQVKDQRNFTLSEYSGGENSSPHIDIWLDCSLPFDLALSREGSMSSFGKKLGIVKDVEIGDPRFDEEFLVKSSEPAQVKSLLRRSELRELLLFFSKDKKFNSLEVEPGDNPGREGRFHLQRSGLARDLLEDPAFAKELLAKLYELVEEVSASQ